MKRNRERTTMAVVGQINDDVDRFLRMELTQPGNFLIFFWSGLGSFGCIKEHPVLPKVVH